MEQTLDKSNSGKGELVNSNRRQYSLASYYRSNLTPENLNRFVKLNTFLFTLSVAVESTAIKHNNETPLVRLQDIWFVEQAKLSH